jgi:hypothetical protein
MLAETVVRTAGINWQEALGIATFATGMISGCAKYVITRVEKSRKAAQIHNEAFVATQIREVAAILNVRLEQVDTHLEAQDRSQRAMGKQVGDVRDRLARVEGHYQSEQHSALED